MSVQDSTNDDSDAESEVGQVEEDEYLEDPEHFAAERDEVKAQFDEDIEKMNQLLKIHSKGSQQDDEQPKRNQLKQQQKTFIDDREMRWRDLSRLAAGQKNFLHHLAYYGQKTGAAVTRFNAKIILRLVDIEAMGRTDSSHRTPLTVAIHEKNWAFVNAACIGVLKDKREEIGKQLLSECQSGRDTNDSRGSTCLQSAILNLSPSIGNHAQSILNMVDFVPKEMFKIADAKGRTPLHISVEYNRGIARQHEIVEKLLERGADALKIKMLNDHGGYTVCKPLQTPRLDSLVSPHNSSFNSNSPQINIMREAGERPRTRHS